MRPHQGNQFARALATLALLGLAAVLGAGSDAAARPSIELRWRTAVEGLPTEETKTFGATWADHDRDGDPDLFINRHWATPWFYANGPRRFSRLPFDLLEENGYASPDDRVDRHGCSWGEATGGGGPELFCTQGAQHGTGRGPNQLFTFGPGGSGRPKEIARRLGVTDDLGRGRSANWIDYDLDGDLDVFVTNAVRKGHPNVMFRNDRGSFERVEVGIAPSETGWPSSTYADWDGDGDFDILLLDEHAGSHAYINIGGTFEASPLPIVPEGKWLSATWGDFDGDGWIDLHLVGPRRSAVMRNVAGIFRVFDEESVDFGRTSAWVDIDNDADLDLFVVQGSPLPTAKRLNRRDFVLLNTEEGFVRVNGKWAGPRRMGNGDAVITSDYDRDGRTDLFVTNGHNPSFWQGPSALLRNTTNGGRSLSIQLAGDAWNPWGMGARILVDSGDARRWLFVTDGVTARAQSEVERVVVGLGEASEARVMVVWPTGERDCFAARAGETIVVSKGRLPC